MLYVMANDFKDTSGGHVNVKLDVDSYFKVYDSDDGTIEEHNGYVIKQLHVDSPGILFNVFVDSKFRGFCTNTNFPIGVYQIPSTYEYFIVTSFRGVYIYDGVYLLRCRYENGKDIQKCSPVLKDEYGYLQMGIYSTKPVLTEIAGRIDMKRIRRAQALNQLDELIADLCKI